MSACLSGRYHSTSKVVFQAAGTDHWITSNGGVCFSNPHHHTVICPNGQVLTPFKADHEWCNNTVYIDDTTYTIDRPVKAIQSVLCVTNLPVTPSFEPTVLSLPSKIINASVKKHIIRKRNAACSTRYFYNLRRPHRLRSHNVAMNY